MLTFRLHMEFAPRARDEAVAVLRALVGPVRSEPGCTVTRLQTREEDGRRLTWVEEWRGVKDFERHLRAAAFRQILAVIEMAAGRPSSRSTTSPLGVASSSSRRCSARCRRSMRRVKRPEDEAKEYMVKF